MIETHIEHVEGVTGGNIPRDLRSRPQWVLWKYVLLRSTDDKPTKVPFQVNGSKAKVNDPSTWADFNSVFGRYQQGDYDGIGFVFTKDDDYCGIDLDGCRDPKTGEVLEWAKIIIEQFSTNTEVSPSGTGVKLFLRGKSPSERGKKKIVEAEVVADKTPGIEVYDHGRYFAVTGQRFDGTPTSIEDRQPELDEFVREHWPERPRVQRASDSNGSNGRPTANIIDRAKKYVAKMPPAVSGQRGHDTAFRTACILVRGFGFTPDEAFPVYADWNKTCEPPWSEQEMWHKLHDADKEPRERNYLRDSELQPTLQHINLPNANQDGHQTIGKGTTNSAKLTSDKLIKITDAVSLLPGQPRQTATKFTVPVAIVIDGEKADRFDITSATSSRVQAEKAIMRHVGNESGAAITHALGKLLIDAEQWLQMDNGPSGPTVREIVEEHVPPKFMLEYRTSKGVWSETCRAEINRSAFLEFTPGWLLQLCMSAVDAPRTEGGMIKEPALQRAIEAALRVVWADILEKLPACESDAHLSSESEAALKFRRAAIKLWTSMTTFEKVVKRDHHNTQETAARASLASRVLNQCQHPELPRSEKRGGWIPIQKGFDGFWRQTGDHKNPILLAMRYTLCDQLRIEIPGVTDQASLRRLGRQYGAVGDSPTVTDRLTGGTRLAVLSPSITTEILAEPTDEPEQSSEGDSSDSDLPSPEGKTQ